MTNGNKLCSHDWAILVDRLIKSEVDLKECGEGCSKHPKTCVSITILRCTKCGGLDKTVILDKNHIWAEKVFTR